MATDGDQWLDRACDAVLTHLAENGPANARQLRRALPELAGTYDPAPGKRWGGDTPLSPRVLTVLSVRGDILRGPNDGTWTTSRPQWAAASQWLTASPEPAPVLESARGIGPDLVANVRTGHHHRHQVVVRQHLDLGAARCGCRRGRGRPRRDTGFRFTRRPRGGAGARPVGRTAAGLGRHPDGLARPRLVSGRAPQPGFRQQWQRRTHRLVERSGGRRLDPRRRRPSGVAAAGRHRTRRPQGAVAAGRRAD